MPTQSGLKACHNCRRRRLKCDYSYPSCHKCSTRGQGCLGYGKLFLWNQGVASRGKMKGKSYAGPVNTQKSLSSGVGAVIPCSSREYATFLGTFRMSLTDPFFQDMDSSCRRYLLHYHLSQDLVISDTPKENSFRSLVPLTGEMPILLHILVANAAMHIASINGRVSYNNREQLQKQPYCLSNDSDRAMIDALLAKHKAISLLRGALHSIQTINTDLIATVVLLFINYELLVSGKNEWRAHVQGALKLLSCLGLTQGDQSSPLSLIRDRITSDCLTYYVLGSTLTTLDSSADPLKFPADILAILRRGEPNSYLSFPTTLLEMLFRACDLANRFFSSLHEGTNTYSALVEEALSLLERIDAFDVDSWALSVDGANTRRRSTRIHTASAHKNAVRIYTCRSVGDLDLLGYDIERLVQNIVCDLSFLDAQDPLFKATAWPTFIAGAETNNSMYRQWAMDRLNCLWSAMPWGYVQTANEVMQIAWKLRDQPSVVALQPGWINQLKGLGKHWLIA
ncbi:hypothetical protein P170DRAFT_392122 [Aspergillus steynii IBT 23096]|uniref:Zn(2)-C6 fungal-type domain-containing protein n=1 Tax=Aspergillus steynii IBT 23096 TaxID=1392250 RepID=A0A2I2FTX5_9EURO|nr:uncharacterized protein P170DRAFT_392122 [Aspergillus steynii IBT 23096]PLB44098.1 hypothetical protein P170DRAFT_392122 [Aspergillus steynii IBT 23096]